MTRQRPSRYRGFTLVEAIVVMAILGILLAIAVPGYQNYVLKANRAAGKNVLLQVAAREQNFFADNKIFSDDAADLGLPADGNGDFYIDNEGNFSNTDVDAIYKIEIAVPPANDFVFAATATAVNRQLDDTSCRSFTINETGVRTAEDSGGTATDACW